MLGYKSKAKTLQTSTLPAVTPPLKTQDTVFKSMQEQIMSEMRNCEKCGQPVHRTKMSLVQGLILCPKCAGKTEVKPKKLEDEIRKFKPSTMDNWEHKLGTMKVNKSKEELSLITELATRGKTPQTDTPICLKLTWPDGMYSEKKICFYVHGEVHDTSHARDHDDEVVAELERQGWLVLVFRHGDGVIKDWADKVEAALR